MSHTSPSTAVWQPNDLPVSTVPSSKNNLADKVGRCVSLELVVLNQCCVAAGTTDDFHDDDEDVAIFNRCDVRKIGRNMVLMMMTMTTFDCSAYPPNNSVFMKKQKILVGVFFGKKKKVATAQLTSLVLDNIRHSFFKVHVTL